MLSLQNWSEVLVQSFQNLWIGVIGFVPNLVVSIIIFIIGWAVGSIVGRWVAQIIQSLKIDQALQSLGLGEVVSRAGFRLDSGAFVGGLIKWFLITVFLVAALDVVGLSTVNDFLKSVVLGYLPQVIVAALMLIVAAPIADSLQRVVAGSAKAAGISASGFFGSVTRWSVWIFAILFALGQLGIAGPFAQTLFTGLVAMLALAGGLAFGLGGKESASRYLDKLRQEMDNR